MELVVLTRDIPEHGLQPGDVGTVVHCYEDGAALEVEFVTAGGKTIAVLTLDSVAVRPMQSGQILHVRELAPVRELLGVFHHPARHESKRRSCPLRPLGAIPAAGRGRPAAAYERPGAAVRLRGIR